MHPGLDAAWIGTMLRIRIQYKCLRLSYTVGLAGQVAVAACPVQASTRMGAIPADAIYGEWMRSVDLGSGTKYPRDGAGRDKQNVISVWVPCLARSDYCSYRRFWAAVNAKAGRHLHA